jgi:uncharacterized protein (DUF1499 family)
MDPILNFLIICCTSFIGPSMGISDNSLNYCPPTPNCVSSESWKYNLLHHIDPIYYKSDRAKVYNSLYKYLSEKENVNIRKETDENYIRVFYFTKIFRFPDKVEFFFPKDSQTIQIRSASVFGIFDFFHNRVRLELIRFYINEIDNQE